MHYKPRLLTGRLRRMVKRFPVVAVTGARQVGKSTLLSHVFPDRPVVVFDSAIDVGNARRDPDLFLDNHPPPLTLDEIQYAPELVAAIKRRVDRSRTPGQYLLTGSQQWAVLRALGESLAGRVVFLDLEGFSLAEIAEQATEDHWLGKYLDDPAKFVASPPIRRAAFRPLFEALWRGFLPEADILEREWISDFHRGYLRTYVERDVRLLMDAGDWQQFGRFVQLCAALTAQEVNYSQLGREVGVTPQTAQRWLAALRGTFQWFEVPPFSGNTVKRVSGRPKGHIADTGFACSLQMISTPQALAGHPLAGPLFESAVAGEVRKLAATLPVPPVLRHWRSHGGAEVDLLLERDGVLFPIEVKLTSRPSRGATSGITMLRKTYPKARIAPGLVIAPTEDFCRLSDHDYAMPWDAV